MTKAEATEKLVRWHYEGEPEIEDIWGYNLPDDDAPGSPIRLLEVSPATLSTGRVDAFLFAPTDEIPFPTVIALVSPEEYEAVQSGSLRLPSGWDEASKVRYAPPAPVVTL